MMVKLQLSLTILAFKLIIVPKKKRKKDDIFFIKCIRLIKSPAIVSTIAGDLDFTPMFLDNLHNTSTPLFGHLVEPVLEINHRMILTNRQNVHSKTLHQQFSFVQFC
jgi:hypothetical protein